MDGPFEMKVRLASSDEEQETPLHRAARDGKHEEVEAMVRRYASGLNEKDEQGRTPLHCAAMSGHRKVCNILLKHGADPCIKDTNQWTPLMYAAELGKVKSCQEILTAKASVDDINIDGDTPLHIACRKGHVGVVNLLLDNGASLNVCNIEGDTCLQAAAKTGKSEVVFAMIKHHRWPEIMGNKDNKGRTPMKLLIEHFPESAELMMDHCIKRSEMKGSNDPNFTVTCDFHFLDPGPDDTTCLCGRRFFGLSTMVKHQRTGLLFHPLTQVLLNKKWSTFGRFIYFNFLSYLVFVGLYTTFIIQLRSDSDPVIDMFVLLAFINIQLIKEVIIICIQRLRYFTVVDNLMEWVLYFTVLFFLVFGLILYIIVGLFAGKSPSASDFPEEYWIVGGTSIFLCYANLVLILRRLRVVGIYVNMFIEVTKTVIKVLLVFFVFFFGFALVFFVLFKEKVVFKDPGFALLKVAVMTVGEVDYEDRFVESSQNHTTTTTPSQTASFVFLGLFLILMTIVLMNLLVGLAVGDIDAIRQNAAFKRLALRVKFIVKVEDSFPRFIARRMYHPEVVLRPNRRTLWNRLMTFLRIENSSDLDFSPRAKEEQSHLSAEYTEVTKKLDKTEKRVKTLVDAMEKQNALLKRLARKIDPGAEMDEHSQEETGLTVENEQGGSASAGVRDEQLPREIKTEPQLYKYEYCTSV